MINILIFITLIFSIIIHEVAHGYVAFFFGDTTAKRSGRLTLNPLKHIDPVGTIILPLLLRLSNSPVVFGWAKPVPVNTMNMRNPKTSMVLVAAAGPLSNIIQGLFLILIGRVLLMTINYQVPTIASSIIAVAITVLGWGVFYNFLLAFFNLIPIPPLDGSRILRFFMPSRLQVLFDKLEPYGILLIFIVLYFFRDAFDYVYKLIIYVIGNLMY
ncbi:MAG: site-2 protease family protein [Candidatus Margulisiibacteriota bacterium]|nr:MAG: site-2 protease family protein [Candidatus Margulisiibacteriota bacterium]HCY35886.1 site-2 protease family protein [Candidatus Margulisiibacteriota bacterium]